MFQPLTFSKKKVSSHYLVFSFFCDIFFVILTSGLNVQTFFDIVASGFSYSKKILLLNFQAKKIKTASHTQKLYSL